MSGGCPPSNLSSGNTPDGHRPSYLISNAPLTEEERKEIDEKMTYVNTLIGYADTSEVSVFPREILESDENFYALFKIWASECNRSYPSRKEELRRFQGFKRTVLKVNKYNTGQDIQLAAVHSYADWLPSDPSYCCPVTEEEAAEYERDPNTESRPRDT